jgi:hypothetical protein
MLEYYQKLIQDWHKLQGNIKIGRDKAYRMGRMADHAIVKSDRKAAQVKKLKAQVDALEVNERVKSGVVVGYRDKLRDAKFAVLPRRHNEGRKQR